MAQWLKKTALTAHPSLQQSPKLRLVAAARLTLRKPTLLEPEPQVWQPLRTLSRQENLQKAPEPKFENDDVAQHGLIETLRSKDLTLAQKTAHFTSVVRALAIDGGHRVMLEVTKTEELVRLLTTAAQGHHVTELEWQRVRAQLVDVAKLVPATAIFAAPGGSVVLPALEKVLPFSILPSSFSIDASAVLKSLADCKAENSAHRGWFADGLKTAGRAVTRVAQQTIARVKHRSEEP